jgi:hypothetical protein
LEVSIVTGIPIEADLLLTLIEATSCSACMGEEGNVCRILVINPERNKAIGRHRRRWEYNIKNVF